MCIRDKTLLFFIMEFCSQSKLWNAIKTVATLGFLHEKFLHLWIFCWKFLLTTNNHDTHSLWRDARFMMMTDDDVINVEYLYRAMEQ